jgi:hypothetical protein
VLREEISLCTEELDCLLLEAGFERSTWLRFVEILSLEEDLLPYSDPELFILLFDTSSDLLELLFPLE